MRATWRTTGSDEDGVAAVEYGLLLSLVAAVVLAAVTALGTGVADGFEDACDALAGAKGSNATPKGGGGGLLTAPGLQKSGC